MKGIKYILLPIVLLFSLFSSTTVHAMDNFSVNMNNVDDTVTFTLTNNSNKNLKDIEYGVKIPKNYKAEYKKNPKYELSSESETTVFEVKISELSDQSSTDSNEMTTYISKQKTVSKLGIVGKVAIGVGVLLVLLVGVLLYRKNKKALIVILIAGLGTQLFPHYTLAANQGRTTEEYSKKVEISGKQVPITLSVTYSVEGENSDNPQQKDEEIYQTVLAKYKNAILDRAIKVDDDSINTVILNDYYRFGEDSKGRDYLNYGFFDIDGNGKDELLIFTERDKDKDNLTSPIDVYTHDDQDKIIQLTPEYVNGNRVLLGVSEDGKTFIVKKIGGAWNNTYDFYSFDGNKLGKTDSFEFDSRLKPEYSRTYPKGQEEKLGKDDFAIKYLNKKPASFDKSKRKSILDYDKQSGNRNYTKSQLALIGRYFLAPESIPDLAHDKTAASYFYLSEDNGAYISGYAVGAMGNPLAIIKVNKTDKGIEISIVDYDNPRGKFDFKVVKKFTWDDINERITDKELDKINKFIEDYKKTDSYQRTHIDD